jgi:glycopeptide antibiotics resistance protein
MALDRRLYVVALILLMPCILLELAVILFPDIHVPILLRAFLFFAIALTLWLCARHIMKRTDDPHIMQRTLMIILVIYVYLLLCVTLSKKSFGRSDLISSSENARMVYLQKFVNLRPFKSIWEVYILGFVNGYVAHHHMVINLLGNLCALVPFSFLLPRIFRAQKKWYVFLFTAVLAVLTIEALQFHFMIGSCDVDDLILNAGGAMIVYPFLSKTRSS